MLCIRRNILCIAAFVLCVCSSVSLADTVSEIRIRGRVQGVSLEDNALSISVRYTGARVDSLFGKVPVEVSVSADAPIGTFTLPFAHNGEYVLTVLGSKMQDYSPLRLSVHEGVVQSVEVRRDPLVRPHGLDDVHKAELVFEPYSVTKFATASRSSPFKSLLKRRYVWLQLFAGAFVIWFPRYLTNMDPDMLYELTGERAPKIGDPNRLLKRLLSEAQ